jgi:hypothetical protein
VIVSATHKPPKILEIIELEVLKLKSFLKERWRLAHGLAPDSVLASHREV